MGRQLVTITITIEVEEGANVEVKPEVRATPLEPEEVLAREIEKVVTTPLDTNESAVPPAPGEPGYDEAFAQELVYRQQMDAAERSAGNPPSWTPEQRARLALSLRRAMAKPETRQRISEGLLRHYAEKQSERGQA